MNGKDYVKSLQQYADEQARMGALSDSFVCLITLTVSAIARAAGWLRVVGWVARGGKR